MNTTNDDRQKLIAELIAQSAKIDNLVVKSRQAGTALSEHENKELENLRAQQKATTAKLHEFEALVGNSWENIGDGG